MYGDHPDQLVEFADNEIPLDLSKFNDSSKTYCALAILNSKGTFNYEFRDCEDTYRGKVICFSEPQYPPCPKPPEKVKRSIKNEKSSLLDEVFIPSKKSESKLKSIEAQKAFTKSFKDMDLQKSYESLFEILWYSQVPCFDVNSVTSETKGQFGMLKSCQWKGMEIPCSKIFTTFPTGEI